MRILIFEDDPEARSSLQGLIREINDEAVIDEASSYHKAKRLISTTQYDLIFGDLMLLPEGWTYDDNTVQTAAGQSRPMTPDEWQRFTIDEGGVELVRGARTVVGPNLQTPIVIMTWFIEQEGHGALIDRVQLDGDPRLVLLPKIDRVRHALNRLSEEVSAPMRPTLEGGMRQLVERCLRTPWEVTDRDEIQDAAELLRASYRRVRLKRDLTRFEDEGHGYYDPQLMVACTLVVECDPSASPETIAALLGSQASGSGELRALRDRWPRLRDWVLLNPTVGVRLTLRVQLRGEPDDEVHELQLAELTTHPSAPYSSDVHALETKLVQRLLLVYLAERTESPPSGREAWGVSEGNLVHAAAPLESDERLDVGGSWGSTEIEPDIEGLLGRLAEGVRLRDRLTELQDILHRKTRGLFFGGDDIIGSNENGWYFNGSLELRLPPETWYYPKGFERQRVVFIALDERIPFACRGGRLASADELELRFTEAGMEVARFDQLADIGHVPTHLLDPTLAIVAPVDDKLLDSFIAGDARSHWEGLAAPERIPTILVLTDDALVKSHDEMSRLRELDIDCMYPSRTPGALDLTKIMDHVICAGYRTRYASVHLATDEPELRRTARAPLTQAFVDIGELGYDGDLQSGAASMRLPDDRIVATASKTDKLSDDPADVALVERVDFVSNEVRWAGQRKPTSSIRWHSLIYRCFPWVNCILHTHWKVLTYDSRFDEVATPLYRLSGSRQEAAEIVQALARGGRPAAFGILRDHGEVFIGEDWESVQSLVKKVVASTDAKLRTPA